MSIGAWLVLVLVVLMIAGVLHQARPGKYAGDKLPRDAARASWIGAGLQELQGYLEPAKQAAVRAVNDGEERTDLSDSGDGASH